MVAQLGRAGKTAQVDRERIVQRFSLLGTILPLSYSQRRDYPANARVLLLGLLIPWSVVQIHSILFKRSLYGDTKVKTRNRKSA